MGEIERAMAKLAAIQKAVQSAVTENTARRGGPPSYARSYGVGAVGAYFAQADDNLSVLRSYAPEWFSDFHELKTAPDLQSTEGAKLYSAARLEQLARDIGQIIEIRANSEHAKPMTLEVRRKVFISHGRSKDWLEVQAHLEKDLALGSLELAQEASQGRTIMEKLEAGSDSCDAAVIVMSGDDEVQDGQPRVRENVMHEIGYFQGKYGRHRVILLHEDGVSVPTNLAGIVYCAYPKSKVDATFGVLDRELRAMYRM